jgi:myo-inositol-1(or 4)-monophosphatase
MFKGNAVSTALLGVAREAAEVGAEAAMAWARCLGDLVVEEKAASDDLVSAADRDAEQAIGSVLAALRPDDTILGEEFGERTGSSGIRWIVDPIDGTTNFLHGRADWAVSVAAASESDGQILVGVVAEPALGRVTMASLGGGTWSGTGQRHHCRRRADLSRALVELNFGRGGQRALAARLVEELRPRVRDLRRGGSAAAALAQVADGRADAYWGPGLRPWDGSAGALLVCEAGGVVGDLGGRSAGEWPRSGDVLASAQGLWEPLRELLVGVYGTQPEVDATSHPLPAELAK